MRAAEIAADLSSVLVTEEEITAKLIELAAQVTADYEGKEVLLVGVLKGAVMVMADFARALPRHIEMDWMAVSSYGAGTKSSGVVQIRKDLDTDIHGKHVLIVEDIIDSGLTLSSWRCCASPRPPRCTSTAATSGSIFRRISSSDTASTTTRSTGTSATWQSLRPTSTHKVGEV